MQFLIFGFGKSIGRSEVVVVDLSIYYYTFMWVFFSVFFSFDFYLLLLCTKLLYSSIIIKLFTGHIHLCHSNKC